MKTSIGDLARRMDGSLFEATEAACPVCLSPPEAGEEVRLQHCGHLHCRGCLAMAVAASSWPLVCSAEECGDPLVTEDFKSLDTATMERLQKNALDHKLLSADCSLAPCPSPNCPGVFRRMSRIASDEEAENESFFCTFCGVNICRRWVGGNKEKIRWFWHFLPAGASVCTIRG